MLRLIFFLIAVPFFVNAYNIVGSGSRQQANFPIIYWDWAISVYFNSDHNPCYGIYDCYIVYGELFSDNNFSSYSRYPTNKSSYGYATLDEFMSNLNLRITGKSYNVATATVPNGMQYPCVNLGYQIGSSSPRVINPTGCVGGPGGTTPPPVSCKVNSQGIFLQHSTLRANELNGNRKEVNVNLSCNRSSSVNLRVTGLNNVGLLALDKNGALYSYLYINNVPAIQGISLKNVGSDGVNVNISSVLIPNGDVLAGEYSAAAILQVNIP
ncbi:hypothetical protein I5R58_09755 [Serratia marcescens]|nr:hypothetical protein [Serratia marcescens]HEJ9150378.1 hypothetical protein [Serratia marcescens]